MDGSSAAETAEYYVLLAYQGILGREADPGGLNTYRNELLSGRTVGWLCSTLTDSEEFSSQRAHLGGHALATSLYQGILGRSPDPGGLAATIDAINNGQLAPRAAAMILSDEASQGLP